MRIFALLAAALVAASPPLTRHVPGRVAAACKAARKGARAPVRCPRLVPKGPPAPYSSAVQGGLYPSHRLYEIDVRTRVPPDVLTDGGELHWTFGGGTAREVERHVISDATNEVRGKPRLVARPRVGGRRVDVYRFPLPPAGGAHGGHMAAFAHLDGVVYFASVHGYHYQSTAVRILAAMLPA